jgi:hypothetical protein
MLFVALMFLKLSITLINIILKLYHIIIIVGNKEDAAERYEANCERA